METTNSDPTLSTAFLKRLPLLILILIQIFLLFLSLNNAYSQKIPTPYSARGYWTEQTKETYQNLKQKRDDGKELTTSEQQYLQDFENYLNLYYSRLTEEEKRKYLDRQDEWDMEFATGDTYKSEEFEWRVQDRALNALYGFWYGSSLMVIMEPQGPAAIGVPLLTGGMWLLGPAINHNKYDGITRSTIRLSNTGKLFGLGYGAALGLLVVNTGSEDSYKTILGLSTVGSIALGEIGFQYQKRNNITPGHIEMLKHYGVLGGGVGLATAIALESESSNVYGGLILAGGIAGILAGNKQAGMYNYTRGDVNAISSLTLASAGLGLAVAVEAIENMDSENFRTWPFIIPAITSLASTGIGQWQVKNVHLTRKQGSTIQLSTVGSGLIGLGLVAILESESPAMYIGIPSGLALLTQQIVFKGYKNQNLTQKAQMENDSKRVGFSVDIRPENYFINETRTALTDYYRGGEFNAPGSIVKLKMSF